MDLTAELSLYLFDNGSVTPIKTGIARLNNLQDVQMDTRSRCTIIRGNEQLVLETLRERPLG